MIARYIFMAATVLALLVPLILAAAAYLGS